MIGTMGTVAAIVMSCDLHDDLPNPISEGCFFYKAQRSSRACHVRFDHLIRTSMSTLEHSFTANFNTSPGPSLVKAFKQNTSLAHSLRRQVAATLALSKLLLGWWSVFS